ncbi:hypothetical protein PZA11_007484 [Diplocarpon coronariae]
MSENYTPGDNALQVAPYDTVFLSQRDLSLRVPINFVTVPGVSLTAACFDAKQYEDDNSANCISNLLSVGFRRFVVDLYWDESRNVWSFCPVAMPASIPDLTSLSTLVVSPGPATSSSSLASGTYTYSSPLTTPTSFSSTSRVLLPRQDAMSPTPSFSSSFSTSAAIISDNFLGNVLPITSSIPDSPSQPLVSIGPYVCTSTINLSVFYTQFLDYIQKTENTLQAHLIYVILNIHASSTTNSPDSPAPEPSNLPSDSNLLGYQFMANLSEFVYTRSNLFSDRLNLNNSWYDVRREIYTPVEGYYQTASSPEGILSTVDGWPSESYIEFARSKRLLLGWGTVDPQMAGYNFSGDSDIIFPNGFIEDVQTNVSATAGGDLTSGCFFGNDTVGLAKSNSSWAVGTTVPDFSYPTTASAGKSLNRLLRYSTNTFRHNSPPEPYTDHNQLRHFCTAKQNTSLRSCFRGPHPISIFLLRHNLVLGSQRAQKYLGY